MIKEDAVKMQENFNRTQLSDASNVIMTQRIRISALQEEIEKANDRAIKLQEEIDYLKSLIRVSKKV